MEFWKKTLKISKIIDCGLKRVGDLPFEFRHGACGTFNVFSEERVMLCFDYHEQRKCRSYSGMDFDTHPDSAWPHSHTSLGNVNNQVKNLKILIEISRSPYGIFCQKAQCLNLIKTGRVLYRREILNKVIAVGDWYSENTQVEVFDVTTNSWTSKTAYPYCSRL